MLDDEGRRMRPYPGQARPQNSPKSPSVAEVPLTVVGHALVLTLLVADAQCAETGLQVSPRGTALAKEFICGERTRASALRPGVETRGLSTQQAPQLRLGSSRGLGQTAHTCCHTPPSAIPHRGPSRNQKSFTREALTGSLPGGRRRGSGTGQKVPS